MSKITQVAERLRQKIHQETFIREHCCRPGAFSRKRKLTFGTIVATLIHLVKRSLQIVCNLLGDLMQQDTPPSKQAFSQARKKISHTGFQALHEEGVCIFYSDNKEGLWRTHRVFGMDGSLCRLPDSEDIESYFERWERGGGNRPGKQPVMGRISEVVELTSRVVVSGRLVPWRQSEQVLAVEQLNEVVAKMRNCDQPNMLFVYDRGYPSKALIAEHMKLKVEFLLRLPRKFNLAIDRVVEQGSGQYLLKPWSDLPEMRVLVYDLPGGVKEVLLTGLTNQEEYPYESFYEVYHARWGGLEETYKLQKIGMELENFSGQSVQAVLQEYWANLIALNLLAMSEVELEGFLNLEVPPKDRMNRVVVFGSIREDLFRFLDDEISFDIFYRKFEALARRHRIKLRPGRSYSREGVNTPKRHHVHRRVC